MFHITEAVAAAARARIKSLWQEVANAALHVLDIDSAIAALREAGNASMVLGLERLRCTEDRYLLAGHVLALTEKAYDTAQVRIQQHGPLRRHAAIASTRKQSYWYHSVPQVVYSGPDTHGLAALVKCRVISTNPGLGCCRRLTTLLIHAT